MEHKPNYYAQIPAIVRYDKGLAPSAKLLYGELTALANKFGYCWATNSYFAELYGVSAGTVSEWLRQLAEKQYIFLEMEEGYKRKIYLIHPQTITAEHPHMRDPLQENPGGVSEKPEGGVSEKPEDNNTSINNTINNSPLPQAEDGEEITIEADEDTVPTKKWKRDTAIKEGYVGHQVLPILRWAQDEYGFKPINVRKEEAAISKMLNSGRSEEDIKVKWSELAQDEFWANKGIDFGVVLSQISKVKAKPTNETYKF